MTEILNDAPTDPQQTIVELQHKLTERAAERDELLRQQAATAEVLKAISGSAFALPAVLQTLLESAARLSDSQVCLLFQLKGDRLLLGASYGGNAEFVDFYVRNPLPLDRSTVSGRVVLGRCTIHVPDLAMDKEYGLPQSIKLSGWRSILGVPLLSKGEVLGTLVLGRLRPGPFSARQIELLETFADQAVIAIENTRLFDEVQARTTALVASLDQLRAAQDRLVQTGKLASLGQLTAGIAHEINSPVGTSLTIASSLSQRCDAFCKEQASGKLRRSELASFVESNRDAANLLVANLQRAAELVQSFKQVAVNHVHEDRHLFDLKSATNQMLASLRPNLRRSDISIEIDVPDGIMMNSYAGPYGQIPTNLFLNAVKHGFDELRGGRIITIKARKPNEDQVEIVFTDDGKGMSETVKHHAFDPFFTTGRNQGGTGLGLHIVHNIVTQQFGGHIALTSEPGHGATFIILMPVLSPG